MSGLGRRVPTDWAHVDKYPLRALSVTPPRVAERAFALPRVWREFYDQGAEGACVGFSSSQMMSLLNRKRYDAPWLWNTAKGVDEWPDTNAGDNNGTSVRAACDVLRELGHRPVVRGKSQPAVPGEGIAANRWATSVDEVRWALARGVPVVLGINWYEKFDVPTQVGSDWWLDRGGLGSVRGGHAIVLEAVSDKRQAVRTPNSWGAGVPRCWFSYATLARLLAEGGEAALVTDR